MTEKNQTITNSYFSARTFTQVIADGMQASQRRKIAGAFVYENTSTYFFSRTNFGKSILAFMIGYSAATGTSIDPCTALVNECPPMKVVVFDLEMDEKTLFDRHGAALNNTKPELLDNLIYLHEKIDNDVVIGFDLLEKIEKAAIEHQAKLVIIDNVSKLLPDSLKAEIVTRMVSTINRIREKTGAAFVIIGHTTKGDPRTAISPTSYYGSAALQNFFTEIFFLDITRDGKFFLCQAKTKREENYTGLVPVFSRGPHPVYGLGFTFEKLSQLDDIQLPFNLFPEKQEKKINPSDFHNEIAILDREGVLRARIAEMFGVNRSSITRLLDSTPPF